MLFGVTTLGGGSAACASGCGTIFRFDPATKVLKTLYAFSDQSDGGTPEGGLAFGTPSGAGAIFALKPKSKKLTALYDFTGGADGGSPQTGMASDTAGALYGVTSLGNGTIFEITP